MSSSGSLVEDFAASGVTGEGTGLPPTPGGGGVYELDEEAANEDVRRMAELLRPQLSDLDDVLKDISTDEEVDAAMLAANTSRTMEEEDDDMDDEIHQLAMSEEALREELEFAQDINDKLSIISPAKENTPLPIIPDPAMMQPPSASKPSKRDPAEEVQPPQTYSLQDHADYLKLRSEKSGGWYYCDMTKFFGSSPLSTDLVKEYCLPVPFRKLKRLYSGLMYHDMVYAKQPASTPNKTPQRADPATPSTPALQASTFSASMTPMSPGTPSTPSMIPPPPPPPPPKPQEEPLPVRTVAIRIRPDVLCGAVMDAVHHAFAVLPRNCTTHILKRQGGHLRGAVYNPDKALAYVTDAQLCTQKGDDLERRLIIRFYHIQDDPEAVTELGQVLQGKVPPSPGADEFLHTNHTGSAAAANRHMQQCCSLIQRLMATQQGGTGNSDPEQQASWLGVKDKEFDTLSSMYQVIGKHLESNFKACPSVREENKKASPTIRRLTLPNLSKKDIPILETSWLLLSGIVDELATRDCTFNTIETLPFGQFPSLPTLDVHFCSQLRRLSRESMISQLLKSAKELEDYARSAEYNCAICITLLEPKLKYYNIPSLELPVSTPLREYPLDYTPPQVSCPPWGSLVMEALNKVAAHTPTGEIDVDAAVQLVYTAFSRQDDEEQGARLGRKNAQIMERLANLQSYQRSLLQNIRDSFVHTLKASKEAESFLKKAQASVNNGQEGHPSLLQEEVPLLSFRISLGASSSGTCLVSAHQILFATSYIPLVGGTKTTVFDLCAVDFEVDESVTSSLLNPFPNTMKVVSKTSREIVYNFRPSIGPSRLQKFLKVIQSFAGEAEQSEFSQVDKVDVQDDNDGRIGLSDAHSVEDQLTV